MDNSQTESSTENKNGTTEGAMQIDSSGGATGAGQTPAKTAGPGEKTGLTDEQMQ